MDRRRFLQTLSPLLLSAGGGAARADDLYRDGGTAWLDDRGRPFALASLQGQASVMTFAYGACRRICSTSLRLLERLQALADARGVALQFVVVGLDATQDRPADWAAFRAERHLQRDNWHFLVGDDAAVRRLATRLGVHYWRVEDQVMHDFRIVLAGTDGAPRAAVEHFDDPLTRLLP